MAWTSKLPDMRVAVIAHPPVFGAKVKTFDAAAAQRWPACARCLPVELDRGGRGVAVVADGYWPAADGRGALKPRSGKATGLEKVDTTKLLASYRELARIALGDAGAGRAPARRRVAHRRLRRADRSRVRLPYLNHAQMEPLACTVDLKDDRCDIYTASQMPGVDAMAIVDLPALHAERVRIHVLMGGGGYGRRACRPPTICSRSVAVRQGAVPRRPALAGEGDLEPRGRHAGRLPPAVHRAPRRDRLRRSDGTVLGWDHRIVSQSILDGHAVRGAS